MLDDSSRATCLSSARRASCWSDALSFVLFAIHRGGTTPAAIHSHRLSGWVTQAGRTDFNLRQDHESVGRDWKQFIPRFRASRAPLSRPKICAPKLTVNERNRVSLRRREGQTVVVSLLPTLARQPPAAHARRRKSPLSPVRLHPSTIPLFAFR